MTGTKAPEPTEVLLERIAKISMRRFNLYSHLEQAKPEQILAARYKVVGDDYVFLNPTIVGDQVEVSEQVCRRKRGDVARITSTDVGGQGDG